MFGQDPKVRKAIYITTFVLGVAVIVLKKVHEPWAMDAVDAANELIAYIGGLTGLVAWGNVNQPPPKD